MTWTVCEEIVEGDVVRFTESVWERRGPRRRQRIVRVGERRVTGQIVTIGGFLVDVTGPGGFTWNTSLIRTDTGNGACEIVWVESLDVE